MYLSTELDTPLAASQTDTSSWIDLKIHFKPKESLGMADSAYNSDNDSQHHLWVIFIMVCLNALTKRNLQTEAGNPAHLLERYTS